MPRGNPGVPKKTKDEVQHSFIQATGPNGEDYVRVASPDELAPINADEAAARLAEGPSGTGRWPTGRKRRTKLAVLGIPSRVLDTGDPAYARCVRLASAYRRLRCRELYIDHGYVSSAVSAFIATASMALAASRYLYEKAAESGSLDALKTAARLGDSARQNELAAWEMCHREAIHKKRAAVLSTGQPWLIQDEYIAGRAKPGPRPKDETLPGLPDIGGNLSGWIQEAKVE